MDKSIQQVAHANGSTASGQVQTANADAQSARVSVASIPGAEWLPAVIAASLVAIFVLLALAAGLVRTPNTTQLGGPAPVIVLTLIGALFNPTSVKVSTPGKFTRYSWAVATAFAAASTAACGVFMCLKGHPTAQQAFEVAAGGLAGLLTNTSALAVLQSLLPNARTFFGLK